MTSTIKEYGLEFINEIAQDREYVKQELGVSISSIRSFVMGQTQK